MTNIYGDYIQANSYDEHGIPQAGNLGRFQYTGQAWLPEVGMYYYKARMYSPTLGRFMQTDPIGYGDGMNWYGYVGGDPVNRRDPSGLCGPGIDPNEDGSCGLEVTGNRIKVFVDYDFFLFRFPIINDFGAFNGSGGGGGGEEQPQSGKGCDQGFLNFFNGLRDLGAATDSAGDKTLIVAGGVAVTGALTTATGVGAPVGLTEEAVAGGLATTGLLAKTVGGGLKLIGDIGAAVETGTLQGTTGTLIARGIIQVVPFADGIVGAVAGQAAESVLPQKNIPRTCR